MLTLIRLEFAQADLHSLFATFIMECHDSSSCKYQVKIVEYRVNMVEYRVKMVEYRVKLVEYRVKIVEY